jgi:Kdo2-lipid IVA lauroyltransferase/acyltransferase
MISRLGIFFLRLLAPLPLSWVRGLGWALGLFLYAVVSSRRRVVDTNLRLCFPKWSDVERSRVTRDVFVHIVQSFLDRAWLWHAKPEVLLRRLVLTGAVHELDGEEATILFVPHFIGMDAGVTALSQRIHRRYAGVYTDQSNKVVDAWMLQGRNRFGDSRVLRRSDGVRALVSVLRSGGVLYLLPDMNFGPEESIFVPFYGVPAATLPSLSRFARLGRAKVVPLITRMTPTGYDITLLDAWANYPTDDVTADTALMNERLQGYIDTMPSQYYWVHKRFKSRPPGEPSVYGD